MPPRALSAVRKRSASRRPTIDRDGASGLSAGPALVGILNVTPDSFYDGGRYADVSQAVQRGLELFQAGAAWVDVGGMSTRPGSEEISVEEEIRRVAPVIRDLSAAHARGKPRPAPAWISIDTCRSAVAEKAMKAGAVCINDVSGFSLDPDMCEFAASARCPVVITHMKGTPKTMQIAPSYDCLWEELLRFFEDRIGKFVKSGGSESFVLIDPGIGFGKTLEHNVDILRGIDRLHRLGRPLFLGCSRKSFIQRLDPSAPSADQRLPGSLAAAAWAALRGVQFLRVHDVAETAQFLRVWKALTHD